LLVCDDTTAYLGGFNLADEYDGAGITRGWRDLGICVQGEVSRQLADTFDIYFARADFHGQHKRQLRRAQKKNRSGTTWRILLSDSRRHRMELRRCLVRDLAAAQTIQIISAYFLPTWRLRWALVAACRRGATVQLILAGKSDVALSLLASHRLYQLLLRSGVEIFEYQPQILHAKLFIMDDVVYAGSANMDTRSLRINHELLVRVNDHTLATEARGIFTNDLAFSKRIDRATWRRSRTFVRKLEESWAYFLLARFDPYVARLQLKWQR